ncbi:MAG: gliding motility protein GldN [Bacteroidia bacterium]|jgi:gliding motility associated protien GldN|nr:gliding motility protein GldN [Bacteroidia bacterium]
MKKLIFLLVTVSSLSLSFAQGVYDDFIYTRQAVQERKVVPWPYLREADVFWAKRITRIIDIREKQNQCMNWPKNPLSLIIYSKILDGTLTPYKDDSLTSVYEIAEFAGRGSDTSIVEVPIDPEDPTITRTDTIPNIFSPENIKKYRVVEDWIFDKKESRMYVRIIAIAPQFNPKVAGIELGEQDLCVLKYHRDATDADKADLREIFINMEVFNRSNDAARVTFDDWFEQRLFSSYIIKEANQYDNRIKDYEEFKDNKVAAMLESERIKNDLFEKEHDLWEY